MGEIIQIVGKEIFPQRMQLEKEFGEVLYDQIIFVLENLATELKTGHGHKDLRLGVYLDSKNPGTRYFEMSEEKYDKFYELFGHIFFSKLKEYSKRQQKLGTNILLQLNQGNISTKDFEKNL
jgi:hypothetical protein